MTNTEKAIIAKFNEYARQAFEIDEDILEPVEIDDTMSEIPTFPFEGIMSSDEDPFAQNYNGPEIFTYIQLVEGKEIYSGAYCLGNFTDEQKAAITEYANRVEEFGEELDLEDTDEGFLIEVGILLDGEDDSWEETFLANLSDDGIDEIESIFNSLVYLPCYHLMDHAMNITWMLNGEMTLDEAVEEARQAAEVRAAAAAEEE